MRHNLDYSTRRFGAVTRIIQVRRCPRDTKMESMTDTQSIVLSKVPEVTLGF